MIIESESTFGAVCKGMDGEVSRQLFGGYFQQNTISHNSVKFGAEKNFTGKKRPTL